MIIFVVIKHRICNWFHSRDLIISNVKRFGCYYYKKWNEYFSAKMKISLRIYPIGHIYTRICMYDIGISIQCRNMGGLSYHFKI